MVVLSVKRRYVDAIMTGRKTVTFRSTTQRVPRVGEMFAFQCERSKPPFARARCLELDRINRADVTLADVQADGFESIASWEQEVRKFYAGQRLLLIRFEVL